MKRAVIFGTTDFAAVAAVYLRHDAGYEVAAFTVDREYIEVETLYGTPVVPFEDLTRSHPPGTYAVFCAIGFSKVNAARRAVFERCRALGYRLPTYVHSSVIRWEETTIGDGCFIFENNVIQPFVSIGDDCVLWSGNHVGHHSRIGDHVFVASHAVISGRCAIGDGSFLGVNATLRDGVTIGANCVIGAGTLVLKDVPEETVLKGQATPAHQLRSHELRRF